MKEEFVSTAAIELAETARDLLTLIKENAKEKEKIVRKDIELSETKNRLENAEIIIANRDVEISEIRNLILNRETELSETKRRFALQTTELQNAENHISAITNSTCWIITKPLRVIIHILRGEFRWH
jgi:hypothetical protein